MSNSNEPPIRKADPCVMVIFGAGGDLTKRKLIPALCNLAASKLLPEQFAVIGIANNDLTSETFRKQLSDEIQKFASCPITPDLWNWFLQRLYYIRGDFDDPAAFQLLKDQIATVEKTHHIPGNHLYYLAVAPRFFGKVVRQLGTAGLAQEENGHWRRVVIEKPFGRDLDSAKALNAEVSATEFSNRFGTAATSIMCKSPPQRRSASSCEAAITRLQGPCATWCRTIFSSSSRSPPWNRPFHFTPTRCAMNKPRHCTPFKRRRPKKY
jgi:hypothetical protein